MVVEDGPLHGYNTDAGAFLKPLIEQLGTLRNARCAIIGAGGAARAALWSLKQEACGRYDFARDIEKARLVAGKIWRNAGNSLGRRSLRRV